ncbi:MAG: aldo/keto reductase [Chloroflexota bacterium]
MIHIKEQRAVSNTALTIPPYGLGAAHIPVNGESVAIETVQTALDNGIWFIDTAPLYGAGKSESYIGKAVAGVHRDHFVLATKVGRLIPPDYDGGPLPFDYSYDGVMRSLDESLARLQLDYVDILHIHDADDHYRDALDSAFPTLEKLRSQGVIKAIGAGMNQWEMLGDFARNADFDCFLLAGRYTLLEQTSLEFLQLCHEKNISVILGGVYNSGILAGTTTPGNLYNYSQAPQDMLDKAVKIAALCQQYDVPLNAAALQFPFANAGVTSMVVGAETPQQVIANLMTLNHPIPRALWPALQEAQLVATGTPMPGSGTISPS